MDELNVTGVVSNVEEDLYSWGDIQDEKFNSMLAIPLLKFVGKRVRVRVEEIDAEDNPVNVNYPNSALHIITDGNIGIGA